MIGFWAYSNRKGPYFDVLNVENVGDENVFDLTFERLREVVINVGPSISTRGKSLAWSGVGTSKGNGSTKITSLDKSLEPLDRIPPSTTLGQQNMVRGKIGEPHMVTKDGNWGEVQSPSMSGPIRSVGSKGLFRFASKGFYRHGQYMQRKRVKQGSDKKTLAEWMSITLDTGGIDGYESRQSDLKHDGVVTGTHDEQWNAENVGTMVANVPTQV
ncbi:hypothetical protein V6N11_034059 [Hibiscus sabdariffa]|uniref:Uncharacterized protein n=1 Tax=Hibiscus sabdariffa TaxID=183260 RepID=A0ABR2S1C0_9ROSI